jgi:hypothetical protein
MPFVNRFVLSVLFSLAFVSSTFAQGTTTASTPTYELSGGYQFTHVPDQNFAFGVNVDGTRHFTNKLGMTAELGWSHDSDEAFGIDFSTNLINLGVGPRWTGFGSGKTWPYAQVLVGAAIVRNSLDDGTSDASDSDTSFMIQPGVGATFVAGDGWGLFGQVDYRRTFFDEPDDVENSVNNQFRVYVGVRMILD